MIAFQAVLALWRRELIRFARQPSRIVSAVGSPLLFWMIIGSGLGASFSLAGGPAGVTYLEYFFPGVVVLLVLFGAIFSTITVIEERKSGFLQGVLVAPVPPGAIAAGKILGGASLAWGQGMLLLALAPLAGVSIDLSGAVAAAVVLAAIAIGLTALGLSFAWRIDSTQGFHGVMNLLLVPMWLLSGAFFPLEGAPTWLEWLALANPLTYGMSAFRRMLQPEIGAVADPFSSWILPLAVTAAFTVVSTLVAAAVVSRRRTP